MLISRALRVGGKEVVALVGAGGKTTLMFRLAGELSDRGAHVVTTMTTHIWARQAALAPAVLVHEEDTALLARLPDALARHGHVLIIGQPEATGEKVRGLAPELVDRVAALPAVDAVILEADGSRGLPFKAPADHEPVIPNEATIVVPLAGVDVVGHPLTAEHVHRPHLVAALTGASLGDPVTPEMIATTLAHPLGGARGVPPRARLVPFLNKVEDAAALGAARAIAQSLLGNPAVDSVLIGATASPDPVREVWSRVGAVILAAGGASRFGALKQVLPWGQKPLVAHVADQALACPEINRVAVTTGAGADQVRRALGERDVVIVPVPDWAEGQSRSVRAGLDALKAASPGPLGAVLFLLADQPGITPALLSALVQHHRESLAPAVAPRYRGQRGNPALFDRATFGEFAGLQGDIGARPVLLAHRDQVAWVEWPTPEVVQDIDTLADYRPPGEDR